MCQFSSIIVSKQVIHDLYLLQIAESSSVFLTVDLDKAIQKCHEEGPEEQPLYIDAIEECIKCKWYPGWQGSPQVKRVNQHCKRDKSHITARRKQSGEIQPLKGVKDIRTYFSKS